MPTTPIYGLPYEHPVNDEPGHTLDGGSLGTEPILAIHVEDELARIDAAVSSLTSRVTALEDGTGGAGWIPIATSSDPGSQFFIDLTDNGRFPNPPLWNLVRIHMRYDMVTSNDSVNVQINGESGTDLYRSAYVLWDTTGNVDLTYHNPDAPSWRIANAGTISTNNLIFTMFHTAANPGLLNFQCSFNRQSDSPSIHRTGQAWGALNAQGRTVSSLRFFTAEFGDGFANTWWWAEGLRMEHPS